MKQALKKLLRNIQDMTESTKTAIAFDNMRIAMNSVTRSQKCNTGLRKFFVEVVDKLSNNKQKEAACNAWDALKRIDKKEETKTRRAIHRNKSGLETKELWSR